MTTEFPTVKTMTSDLPAEKKEAIFSQPECKKLFEEKVAGLRLSESDNAYALDNALNRVVTKVSFASLGLSFGEFEMLINNACHEVHTGIVIKAISIIEDAIPENYCDAEDYIHVIRACHELKKEIGSLLMPCRDEAIEAYYQGADHKQLDNIDKAIKDIAGQRERRQMPGLANAAFQNGIIIPEGIIQ